MAYQLPQNQGSPSGSHGSVVRARGRPRTYDEDTLSVNFRVPASLREQGSAKARAYEVNITKLMAIHYRNFVTLPIEITLAFIAAWEREHGSGENGG